MEFRGPHDAAAAHVDGKLHSGERNHRAIIVIIVVCLYQALMDEPAAWPVLEDVEEPEDLATQDSQS